MWSINCCNSSVEQPSWYSALGGNYYFPRPRLPLISLVSLEFASIHPVQFITEKLIKAMLGVSRTIYVNVDSPNLGFPYYYFLGATSEKTTLYHSIYHFRWPRIASIWVLQNLISRTIIISPDQDNP